MTVTVARLLVLVIFLFQKLFIPCNFHSQHCRQFTQNSAKKINKQINKTSSQRQFCGWKWLGDERGQGRVQICQEAYGNSNEHS